MKRAVILTLLVVAMGCPGRGTLRDDDVFVRDSSSYQVVPPGDGWRRVRAGDADLAWQHPKLAASLLYNSHCEGVDDAPLTVLTNHLLFDMSDREWVEQNEMTIARRAGLLSRVRAKLDGVQREMLILVVKKSGCVYDLVLDASPENLEAARPAFDRAVARFDITERT